MAMASDKQTYKHPQGYYAILGKYGDIKEANLPDGVHAETLAIMVASAYGASDTIVNELKCDGNLTILIESENVDVKITQNDKDTLLAMVFPKKKTADDKIQASAPIPAQ